MTELNNMPRPESSEEKKQSPRKRTAVIAGSVILTAAVSYGALWTYQANDSLSKVPRAKLMPDQATDNKLLPDPHVSSSSPSPTSSLATVNERLRREAAKAPLSAIPSQSILPHFTGAEANSAATQAAPGYIPANRGGGVSNADSEGTTTAVPPTKADATEIDNTIKTYSRSASSVKGVSTQLPDVSARKAPDGVETYVLMGTDSRNPKTQRGRSDSLMIAYVNKAHDKVYLISFPRDLYVKIPGYAKQKINAAYSYGGAPLMVRTLESFTGTKMDHAALVNFNSFVNMVDSVGGVTVHNPYTGCDNHQHLCWKKGNLKLSSFDALHYVRWRHGLPNGDITRSQNQQRVVKAVLEKVMSPGNLANPSKLSGIISEAGKNVVLDESLTNKVILEKALGMRLSSGADIRTITAPIVGYYMDPIYGSVDLVNGPRMRELRGAMANDSLDSYWNKYKNAPVAGPATRY